jgi:hypothetical protein
MVFSSFILTGKIPPNHIVRYSQRETAKNPATKGSLLNLCGCQNSGVDTNGLEVRPSHWLDGWLIGTYNYGMKYAMKTGTGATRNFHLPLSEELYELLREESERSQRPATAIARDAIESWLRERRRSELYDAIADYAARHAGSDVDLMPDLEAAGVEHLLQEEP